MRKNSDTPVDMTNPEIAATFQEIADRLQAQAANPFRVAAYRNAATIIHDWPDSVCALAAHDGVEALQQIPGIGKSLARKISRLQRQGTLPALEKLRKKQAAADVLTSLPTVGPCLAHRIRSSLGAQTLEEVYAAAYDGRLHRVAGMGRKRVQAIRECLSLRLNHPPIPPRALAPTDPSVADLLEIDRMYREQAAKGRLVTVAPRRFNPTGEAWLPILRVKHNNRRYCAYYAYYANSVRSHQLDHLHDWVVVYCLDKEMFGRWTILTSTYGRLRGKRIVRGRESQCTEFYGAVAPVQLSLLPLSQALS